MLPELKLRLDVLWDVLVRAPHDRHEAMRHVVFCTAIKIGGPDARTVILRGADRHHATFWFHTDRRSAKVQQMEDSGLVCAVAWDPQSALQLRLRGQAQYHSSGAQVEERWRSTPDAARRLYRTDIAPGGALGTTTEDGSVVSGPAGGGRENFCVVDVSVEHIDALWLHSPKHERAQFWRDSTALWQGQWVAP